MDRPTLTVGDIFRRYGEADRHAAGRTLASAQRRVMSAIESCRTAALGGHVEHDTRYFHIVFTVPHAIAEIAAQNTAVVYGILFRATADTLRTIAADPRHLGAAIGLFAVLHTWGQTLIHPHPLLRLAWPSAPHGDTRPMPATPRDGRGATDRWRHPVTVGLARPLRVPHRRLVTTLSCLCGRAHDRDAVLAARGPVPGASRYLLSRTRAPRTVWGTSHASRDGTRVSPALVPPPQDSAYGACTSLASPRNQRRSSALAPVTPAAVSRPTSFSTPASIQSPYRSAYAAAECNAFFAHRAASTQSSV